MTEEEAEELVEGYGSRHESLVAVYGDDGSLAAAEATRATEADAARGVKAMGMMKGALSRRKLQKEAAAQATREAEGEMDVLKHQAEEEKEKREAAEEVHRKDVEERERKEAEEKQAREAAAVEKSANAGKRGSGGFMAALKRRRAQEADEEQKAKKQAEEAAEAADHEAAEKQRLEGLREVREAEHQQELEALQAKQEAERLGLAGAQQEIDALRARQDWERQDVERRRAEEERMAQQAQQAAAPVVTEIMPVRQQPSQPQYQPPQQQRRPQDGGGGLRVHMSRTGSIDVSNVEISGNGYGGDYGGGGKYAEEGDVVEEEEEEEVDYDAMYAQGSGGRDDSNAARFKPKPAVKKAPASSVEQYTLMLPPAPPLGDAPWLAPMMRLAEDAELFGEWTRTSMGVYTPADVKAAQALRKLLSELRGRIAVEAFELGDHLVEIVGRPSTSLFTLASASAGGKNKAKAANTAASLVVCKARVRATLRVCRDGRSPLRWLLALYTHAGDALKHMAGRPHGEKGGDGDGGSVSGASDDSGGCGVEGKVMTVGYMSLRRSCADEWERRRCPGRKSSRGDSDPVEPVHTGSKSSQKRGRGKGSRRGRGTFMKQVRGETAEAKDKKAAGILAPWEAAQRAVGQSAAPIGLDMQGSPQIGDLRRRRQAQSRGRRPASKPPPLGPPACAGARRSKSAGAVGGAARSGGGGGGGGGKDAGRGSPYRGGGSTGGVGGGRGRRQPKSGGRGRSSRRGGGGDKEMEGDGGDDDISVERLWSLAEELPQDSEPEDLEDRVWDILEFLRQFQDSSTRNKGVRSGRLSCGDFSSADDLRLHRSDSQRKILDTRLYSALIQ